MKVDYSTIPISAKTVAVALSGGSDSMALIHHARQNLKDKTVIALNVEHGIRGESSLADTRFVAEYCAKNGIELITYTVDSLLNAKENKLSVEQSARQLRYECFFDAISTGKADAILTAHHERDTAESVLFNLFRGTGLKGVAGINDFNSQILRPLSKTPKTDIEEYIKTNSIPYCTDQTNFDNNYSRNYIRLNILPVIEKAFPDAQKSINRFSEIAKEESDFLDELARKEIIKSGNVYKLKCELANVIFKRAVVQILKLLGKPFDYEKIHLDLAYELCSKQNGSAIDLGCGIVASKEYENIVFSLSTNKCEQTTPLIYPQTQFLGATFTLLDIAPLNLTDGLYIDADALPENTIIRTKRDGDLFTKFGGGTKKLNDYLTDKKIPKRERDSLVVLASSNQVYAIAGVAVSEKAKVTTTTKRIIKITY